MYFFTADEHFFHKNIIKYCNRPFNSVSHMHEELIRRHNEVVSDGDTVIHAGDFSLNKSMKKTYEIVNRLNGNHIFLKGSHDKWMRDGNGNRYFHEIWEKKIGDYYIVVCHYAMRTWTASHYNTWHVYGHSHGKLEPIGKSIDIGVDTNNFYPYSFDDIKKIMDTRPDNPNYIPPERRR